jgi:hypothetical protein
LENETRKLAEDLAILRLEVDEVKHGKQPDVTDRPA